RSGQAGRPGIRPARNGQAGRPGGRPGGIAGEPDAGATRGTQTTLAVTRTQAILPEGRAAGAGGLPLPDGGQARLDCGRGRPTGAHPPGQDREAVLELRLGRLAASGHYQRSPWCLSRTTPSGGSVRLSETGRPCEPPKSVSTPP